MPLSQPACSNCSPVCALAHCTCVPNCWADEALQSEHTMWRHTCMTTHAETPDVPESQGCFARWVPDGCAIALVVRWGCDVLSTGQGPRGSLDRELHRECGALPTRTNGKPLLCSRRRMPCALAVASVWVSTFGFDKTWAFRVVPASRARVCAERQGGPKPCYVLCLLMCACV